MSVCYRELFAFDCWFSGGRKCARKCLNRKDGNYPHCDSCSKFVTCSKKSMYENDCPSVLEWDDNARRCEWAPSPTCASKCGRGPSSMCTGKCEMLTLWFMNGVLLPRARR